MTRVVHGRDALRAAILVAALSAAAACGEPLDPDVAIAEIEARYGITVEYEIEPDFLPAEWRAPPLNGRVEPIAPRQLEFVLRELPSWLDKYPATTLAADLKGIRLTSLLEFDGAPYAGTASDSFVYIVVGSRRDGFDERFLERTFHHELSSVLIYHHLFPIYDWVDANPEGFEYLTDWNDVRELLDRRPNLDGDPAFYRQGLLAEYAGTNLENDVNLYAEVTFAQPGRMKELVETYPAIRAKYEVFRDFYIGIDPRFQAWFARIG